MHRFPAWLLPVCKDYSVIIAKSELKHLEGITDPIQVPTAPPYCHTFMFWQASLLPLFNLKIYRECFTDSENKPESRNDRLIAVVAYKDDTDNKIKYGGLNIDDTPELIHVHQNQALNIHSLSEIDQRIGRGALRYNQHTIPILDLGKIFCTVHKM